MPKSKDPTMDEHADQVHPVTQPERQMDPAVAAKKRLDSAKFNTRERAQAESDYSGAMSGRIESANQARRKK